MATMSYSHQWIDWVREDESYFVRVRDVYNVDGGKPVIGFTKTLTDTPYRKVREVREAIKEMTRQK